MLLLVQVEETVISKPELAFGGTSSTQLPHLVLMLCRPEIVYSSQDQCFKRKEAYVYDTFSNYVTTHQQKLNYPGTCT
jgi:hypothetical protein